LQSIRADAVGSGVVRDATPGEEIVRLSKLAGFLSAVVAAALLATACGSSDDDGTSAGAGAGPVPEPKEPVTITFASWVGKERGMKALYKKFQAEHPNITVDFQDIPPEEASRKLTTQVAGGNPPDTAYMDAVTIADFSSRGALVDLTDYMKRSKLAKPDDFVESFRATTEYEGKMYALPFDGESTGLFYRTDLFEAAGITEPPKTWEEFEATAQKLTQPDKKQYGTILFSPSPESAYYYYPWLWQAGGELLSQDEQKVEFSSDAGKQAADFYVGLKEYSPRDFLNSNSYDGRIAFARGTVGMYVAGAWLAGVLREEFPKIDGKWATAPLPEGSAGCATTIAGDNLALFAQGEKKDAAWKWIEFLASEASQRAWTIDDKFGTLLPTRTKLLESPELAENKPVMKGFAEAMKCGKPPIANPKWPKIEERLSEQLARAMYDEQSPAEAMDVAADEAQEIIDR
jgi:multiple sugar transport system substrate-binding protein